MSLKIRRLSFALGAEISGIDITKHLDDETFKEIHAAYLEYSLLLFRKQPLDRKQHIALAGRFGELDRNEGKLNRKVESYPEIELLVSKKPEPGKTPYITKWHSDGSSRPLRSGATLLRSVQIPNIGGDTMFSNMYLAYETLSHGMKKLVEALQCVYVGGVQTRIDFSSPEREAETRRLNTTSHPLVNMHAETRRKSLYIGEKIELISGMTAEESKPLLQFLCRHATRPQFLYRHQWQLNDLLVWDNRCTLHYVVEDFDKSTQVRHLEAVRTMDHGLPTKHVQLNS